MRDINQAQMFSGPAVRYMLVDASEQGGIDWELVHIKMVGADDLLPLWEAQTRLIQLRATIRTAEDQEAAAAEVEDEVAQINQIILRSMQHHTLAPVALGNRRGGLEHRIQCLMHAIRLEVRSMTELKHFLQSLACTTTDMGVEHLLSEVRSTQSLSQ